jgi:hypothetical protein
MLDYLSTVVQGRIETDHAKRAPVRRALWVGFDLITFVLHRS